MQFMVILTVVAILVTREDAPMGMIMLVSETDMLFANVGKLHKVIRLKGTKRYRVVIYVGAVATILSRGLIPLGYLALALLSGSPLKMSISATTVFFVGLVACGAINTWRINSAIARICKKEERIIEVVPYTNMSGEGGNASSPKPEEIASSISANIEMPPSYNEVFAAEDAEPVPAGLDAGPGLTFTNPMAEALENTPVPEAPTIADQAESNLNTFVAINLGASELLQETADATSAECNEQCSSAWL